MLVLKDEPLSFPLFRTAKSAGVHLLPIHVFWITSVQVSPNWTHIYSAKPEEPTWQQADHLTIQNTLRRRKTSIRIVLKRCERSVFSLRTFGLPGILNTMHTHLQYCIFRTFVGFVPESFIRNIAIFVVLERSAQNTERSVTFDPISHRFYWIFSSI